MRSPARRRGLEPLRARGLDPAFGPSRRDTDRIEIPPHQLLDVRVQGVGRGWAVCGVAMGVAGSAREAELEELVAEQAARIGELEASIEELLRRLSQDSRNSSKPPSSDPPLTRAERRREAREKLKELSRRKAGGQPGHEGKHRQLAPGERVDRAFEYLPGACACGHGFDGSEIEVSERPGTPGKLQYRKLRRLGW